MISDAIQATLSNQVPSSSFLSILITEPVLEKGARHLSISMIQKHLPPSYLNLPNPQTPFPLRQPKAPTPFNKASSAAGLPARMSERLEGVAGAFGGTSSEPKAYSEFLRIIT
jgi:hypothetical protein